MKTSHHQFDLLVSYMEQQGDLSKPTSNARGRVVALQKWEELTSLLNSDGSGDTKTTEKWKKVWSDFKNNIKKKAARLHRAAHGTGGGPAILTKLTDIEQRVLNLIGVQVATGLAIPEAGFSQNILQLPEKHQPEVQLEIEGIDLLSEPGTSQQQQCVPGPSSQGALSSGQVPEPRPARACIESRPPSQVHVDPPSLRPIVSPSFIIVNEEPIENIRDLANSPDHTAAASASQPAQFGQTTPRRRLRASRIRLSPGSRPSPRRRTIQGRQTEQAAQHFLHSDAEWRAFRMQQHNDHVELKKEQNRIRELEINMQKDWQTLGLRALDILDKLVNKFCSE